MSWGADAQKGISKGVIFASTYDAEGGFLYSAIRRGPKIPKQGLTVGPQQAGASIVVASKGGLKCAAGNLFFKDELLRQISLHDAEENWPNFKRVPWAYPGGGVSLQNMGGPWPLWPRPTKTKKLWYQIKAYF